MLQYQRSTCDKQYLPERRSVSKIFAGMALHYTPGSVCEGGGGEIEEPCASAYCL